MKLFEKKWILGLILVLGIIPKQVYAFPFGFDVSLSASYNRTNYGPTSYSWTRRWSASVGYALLPITEIEFSYQDITNRNKIAYSEDTTFQDKVYSLNLVQYLTSRRFPIQPFLRFGVGQLNRDATGSYYGGYSPVSRYDALTVVVGLGIKIFFTRTFSVNGDVTSYLTGGKISSWRDNIGASLGTSFYF